MFDSRQGHKLLLLLVANFVNIYDMETDDLKQLLELCKENNHILRGMQRSARVAKFFKAIYWMLIIGSLVGSYYYIQPYVDKLINLYNNVSNVPDVNNLKLSPDILKQLDSLLKNK